MEMGLLSVSARISWIDLSVIAAYMVAMLGVGYFIRSRLPNFDEFMVAGRTMTTPILICTLVSTYYGLDVLFGTSELAFNNGVVAFFGYSQLSLAVYLFAALFLTKPLRSANFKSLPDVLERNYGRGAATMGALASFVYSIPALSLFGLGRLCEVVFGVDAEFGAMVIGGVALLYTLWGGLWAVAITDTVQFVLMCITLAIAIPMVMQQVGGFDAVAAVTPTSFFEPFGSIPIWLVIAYAATGISILVDPGFYQRVFAARDHRQARNALLIGLVVWGAYDWLVTAGGMLGVAAANNGMISGQIHPNDVLLTVVALALPIGLAGIFLSGTLAAAMSTIDSYSLVAGGNLAYDIYRPVVNPRASDRELVRLTKMGIVLSWGLGYLLAFSFDRLMALWVFTASVLMSTVMIPVMMGLFWKGRKTPLAGVLSCSFGLVGVIAFYLLVRGFGVENKTFGTYIWTFSIGQTPVSLWQEYSLFFTLPLSFLGYLLGNRFGRERDATPATAERE
jgi:SSS family solute:Na+ symporter